jgi:hypothetical protein
MTEAEARARIAANPKLVEDEREFREHVVVQLALINQQAHNDRCDLQRLERCVFGPNGDSGLVDEVKTLRHAQNWWNRGLAVTQALVLIVLTWFGFSKN